MPDSQQKPLKEFWKSMSREERTELAKKAGTTPQYLRQVLAHGRRCSPALAKEIEVATDRGITRQMLCPEIFGDLIRVA